MKKLLIIEDEPRAVQRLTRLLAKIRPDWELLGTADTVPSAVSLLKRFPDADLAFCDIQLADGLSFEALESAKTEVPIIFVTAYDQYAMKAFDHWSVDYLLKPTGEEELEKALQKLERMAPDHSSSGALDLHQLIKQISGEQVNYRSRFLVKVGDKLKFFPIDEVLTFYSEDRVSFLVNTDGRSYPLDLSLEEIDQAVDPQRFFRINRKFIVSPEAIKEIAAWSNSRLRLTLHGLEEEMVVVARERTSDFKSWLDQ